MPEVGFARFVAVRVEKVREALDIDLSERYMREGIRQVLAHAGAGGQGEAAAVLAFEPVCKAEPKAYERVAVEPGWYRPRQSAAQQFGEPRVVRPARALVIRAHVIGGEHRRGEIRDSRCPS